ncbi:hypothetical protein GJ496_001549 [Pomphorhynchus laevis]|nr:hypothetical protein GJ496_001549 [Pomphorhynchus laevis]
MILKGPRETKINEFLNSHREHLDEFIINNYDVNQIEQWIAIKNQREQENAGNQVQSKYRSKSAADIHKRFDLEEKFTLFPAHKDNQNKALFLYELAKWMFFTAESDFFEVYEASSNEQYLYNIISNNTNELPRRSSNVFTVSKVEYSVQYTARKRNPLALSFTNTDCTSYTNSDFPKGVFKAKPGFGHVLSYPIITADDHLIGVIELFRRKNRPSFTVESLYERRTRLKSLELNDFLLDVTQSIFQNITNVDVVILRILKHAKTLVKADRTSMFLVDFERNELYAKVFDFGDSDSAYVDSFGEGKWTTSIRFPMNRGIAGYVASTGNTVNVEDAYKDERFNREIDLQTGYHTKSILCMPIFSDVTAEFRIIGVVQMVNKESGSFTLADEIAFKLFANYCGLALGHAQMYERLIISEQKLKVAIDILTYHASCHDDEYATFVSHPLIPEIADLNYDSWNLDESLKPAMAVAMFRDLFPDYDIDEETLIRFIITIRKNYRMTKYHNWCHAFTVANSTYAILKKISANHQYLKPYERLGLYISSLCHDLDHIGKTNSYMVKSGTTLGNLYAMSTMENHHFNRAVTILQQDSCNILKNLKSAELRVMLTRLKHCILSTDLEVHFKHLKEFRQTLSTREFDCNREEDRKYLMSLIMTTSDLSANFKPFNQQSVIMLKVMEEFWEQGDEEGALGFPICEMMDRNHKHTLPQQQIGFLTNICIPCFELIVKVLPELQPIVDGCLSNITKWENVDSAYIESLLEKCN